MRPSVTEYGSQWAVQLQFGRVICATRADADRLAEQIEKRWPDADQNQQP